MNMQPAVFYTLNVNVNNAHFICVHFKENKMHNEKFHMSLLATDILVWGEMSSSL